MASLPPSPIRAAGLLLTAGLIVGLQGLPGGAATPSPGASSGGGTTTSSAGPILPEGSGNAPVLPATPQAAPAAGTAAVVNTRILLALGKRELRLEQGGKVYGPWPVAIGEPGTPTPTGTFKVTNKVVNPQYVSTKSGQKKGSIGPNGPLGDRWIGFHTTGKDDFGIHGTPAAWAWTVSSRAAVTHGCVRMFRDHVHKLFDLVQLGTPVVITR